MKHLVRLAACIALCSSGYAQSYLTRSIEPSSAPMRGFGFYGVSMSTMYLTTGFPGYSATPIRTATGEYFDSDYFSTVSASVGWTRPGPKSNFSVMYTPSYMASASHSDWNAWNHGLNVNFGRPKRLSRRWDFNFSAGGTVNNFRNVLFMTSLSGNPVVAGTFDDLAAGITHRDPSLSGSSQVDAAARALVFGDRTMAATARGSFTYHSSRRLSVNFDISGARTQHINSFQSPTGNIAYVVPYVNSAQFNIDFSYSYSSHSQIGVIVGTARSFSRYQDAYSNNLQAYAGRTIGRRWVVNVMAGSALIVPVRTAYVLPTRPQLTTGGMLGFKTRSQTFFGNVNRAVGDNYGFGAFATTSANASWQYDRPSSDWSVYVNYGQTIFTGSRFSNASGWQAGAGIGRMIGHTVQLQIGYSALSYTANFADRFTYSVQAVRLGFSWFPANTVRHR